MIGVYMELRGVYRLQVIVIKRAAASKYPRVPYVRLFSIHVCGIHMQSVSHNYITERSLITSTGDRI